MSPTVGNTPPDRAVYSRRRFVVAASAALVAAVPYVLMRKGSARSDASVETGQESANPGRIDVPGAPTGSAPAPRVEPSQIVFDHALGRGATGSQVVALQDRLRQLAFDPGPSDAQFGPATERAVWAYEKFILGVERAAATGVVTPEMWVEMNRAISVRPRRENFGTHLEVLLPQQVAVLYIENVAQLITHISSGSGEEWCDVVVIDNEDGTQREEGICGVAVTPGGVFHFERRVVGWRNSKLGRLYNPVYFNYGIAVHGATNVPAFPASKGCVRIPMHIAEYFPSLVEDGDLVYIFDGLEQPETYGAQLPVFDYPDPDYTTTTSPPPATTTTTTGSSVVSTVPVTTHPHVVATTVGGEPSSTTVAGTVSG